MGGCKFKKHTAAALASKASEATTNKGGGKSGLSDRKGGSAGHAKYQCPVCKQAAPDPKSMQMHFESKHPKETFNIESCMNLHEAYGATTTGVAVAGSKKK
eukprot:GDKH01024918.1.p1 GENE.GDKH01024918.1~~GDKH01024918.1.p1  ORF type:complete len:101 (-),score=11.96 GDKH01024918.1:333-635(-)